MNVPSELSYTKSHEWIKFDTDKTAAIGLTDYAQNELGDLVFVNLPEADSIVTSGETMADVESVKAVSDVYSPVTGVVKEINEELLDNPEKINENPYDAWLVKVVDITYAEDMMTAGEYEKFVEEEKAKEA